MDRRSPTDRKGIAAVTNPLVLGYRRMAMIGVRADGPTSSTAASLEAFQNYAWGAH